MSGVSPEMAKAGADVFGDAYLQLLKERLGLRVFPSGMTSGNDVCEITLCVSLFDRKPDAEGGVGQIALDTMTLKLTTQHKMDGPYTKPEVVAVTLTSPR